MKHLKTIYIFLISFMSGCMSVMAQVQPDSVRLSGMTDIPGGLQWSYKTVGGTVLYNGYNPKTGKYSLFYPAQWINRNVLFNKPDSSGFYPFVRVFKGEGPRDIKTLPDNIFGYVDRRSFPQKITGFPDTTSLRFNFLKVGDLQRGYMLAGTWDKDELFFSRGFAGDYRGWHQVAFLDQLTNVVRFVTPPTTKTSPGTAGTLAYNNGYFYICVSTNHWERMPYDPTNW